MSDDVGNTDSWCTPPEVAVPLHDTLFQGPATVDPASNPLSIIQAKIHLYEGGLLLPWWDPEEEEPGDDFENPPYSISGAFTQKLLAELKAGRIAQHVRLVPGMTSSQWWADQCTVPKRNPRIIFTKRISFIDPFTSTTGRKGVRYRRMPCRHEPALVYYGPKPALFDKAFKHLNRWSTWGR